MATTIYFEVYNSTKGSRKRISSRLKVQPSNWSLIKARVLPSDQNYLEKNSEIDKKYLSLLNKLTHNSYQNDSSELINYLEKFIQLRIALGRKRTSYKEFITIKNRM